MSYTWIYKSVIYFFSKTIIRSFSDCNYVIHKASEKRQTQLRFALMHLTANVQRKTLYSHPRVMFNIIFNMSYFYPEDV